jgi:hypothetical protein
VPTSTQKACNAARTAWLQHGFSLLAQTPRRSSPLRDGATRRRRLDGRANPARTMSPHLPFAFRHRCIPCAMFVALLVCALHARAAVPGPGPRPAAALAETKAPDCRATSTPGACLDVTTRVLAGLLALGALAWRRTG